MTGDATDPTVVRSIAVTADDVLTAIQANRTSGRRTVLRLTPPFSGRMRARLHVRQEPESTAVEPPQPVHVDPETLLAPGAPPFPHPDETEARIRASSDLSYSVELHRDRHVRAIEGWRRVAREHLVDSVELPLLGESREVDVAVLG